MRLHIWALVSLAGVAGLIAGAGPARAQADPKTVVATVNGRTITMGEVETAIKARGPLPVEISGARRQQMQFEVVCMLIDGALWEQYLAKNGPRVDAAEVNKHMGELEQMVKKANKTMQDYYKESGQTEATVRAGIVSILQWEAIARGKISDADVKRYYDENKDFFDGVTVRASHIMMKVAPGAPDAEKQAARDKLLAIRAHIVAGTLDFAEAAKRYSQCVTAPEGGDLGSFPRKMVIDESIAKAAFALPVGGVSDVVQSDYGLHLIKVTERKPGEQPSDFAKIKDVVRDFCTEELRHAVLAEQRQAAKVEIKLPK
jgi:peptidyl-prolyl cis-trans isomerase C